ncbi:MAG: hypothetical protein FJX99_09600 [Bacteroidetes bacterium]|nr:hypothetical protein [Bacteroidota bacterium]
MTIYYNDDRDYTEIIEGWIREFISTMDEDEDLHLGNDSGEAPAGVKIIFDGFGDLETENDYIEGGNKEMKSFAVFIHKNSLIEDFPPHEQTPWALIHRPKEEVCIWAWYDKNTDDVSIIPFEDNNSTELDHKLITDLIFAIHKRDTDQ